jgi:hypothetical protein
MRARTTLLGWLRGDRGEADPVAVVAGSIVFMIASIAVAGTITLGLAASTRAQANIELTQKVETFVAQWKATPYGSLTTATAKATAPATDGFTGKYTVTKDAQKAFHITVAAARQVGLTPKADCTGALTGPNANCLVLEGTVSPTPFDVTPQKPTGITQVATAVGRGIRIATIDRDQVAVSNAIDLRVSIKPVGSPAPNTALWRLTLTCDDTNPITADTPDSTFITAANGWVSARVTLKNLDRVTVCAAPSLRLWANSAAGQPTVATAPVANVQIWRVSGGAQ